MGKLRLVFDKKRGEMFFNKISSALVPRGTQVRSQIMMERILGPGIKAIMYESSKRTAMKRYALFCMLFGKGKTREDIASEMIGEFPKMGYGVARLVESDWKGLGFRVEIRNCFNTIGYDNSKKPVCYMMSGILAGLFTAVLGKGMDCSEEVCSSTGKDACVFYIKTTNKYVDIKKIASSFMWMTKKSGGESIEVSFDEKRGEIFYEKSSAIITLREQRAEEQRGFERIIGPATKSLLYEVGREETKRALSNAIRYLIKVVGVFSKKIILYKMLHQINERGLGAIEIKKLDERENHMEVRIKNCYNSMGYKNSKKPICYIMSGILGGASSVIFGTEIFCKEVKCQGMGHKYCEFVLEPKP